MASQEPLRLLLRPGEVADLLGVSRSKVYELIATRVIPTIQVGSRARVPLHALREWIDRRMANGRAGLNNEATARSRNAGQP